MSDGVTKFVIEVYDPGENSANKYQSAVDALSKALLGKSESYAEPTPYRALRELSESIVTEVARSSRKFVEAFARSYLRKMEKSKDDFKLKGKTFINPKSGKFLTVAEWNKIAKDIDRIFGKIYGQTQDSLVKRALALGRIINTMEPGFRTTAKLDDLALMRAPLPTVYDKILHTTMISTGELIQDMTQRTRKAVSNVIIKGYQDNMTPREIEDALFDEFGQVNRDWRRIAETETATNFNNGYLLAEKEIAGDEPVFMIGISGASACNFCRDNVKGKVVVLLDDPPPAGDVVDVDGKMYTAIWPGKSNFGRKRANWWVAAGSQHPHCVLGGSLVLPGGRVRGASKREYIGEIITIKTAGNRILRCTPRHPVLAHTGFIPACAFNVGDEIGCSGVRDWKSATGNYDVQKPTCIEDIVDSVLESSGVSPVKVPVATEDFHGDGGGSKVAIIGANSGLSVDSHSVVREAFDNVKLIMGCIRFGFFNRLRNLIAVFGRLFRSFYCDMRIFSLALSLGKRHILPFNKVGMALATYGDFGVKQSGADDVTGNSELFSKGIFGRSSGVQGNDSFDGQSVLYEFPAGIAGAIKFDVITHIDRSPFKGYVYNLETETSYYIAGGIVNHNCRCTWTRFSPAFEEFYTELAAELDESINQ